MRYFHRLSALLLAFLLVCSLCPLTVGAAGEDFETTILFTHDLHSHFLPQPTEDGGESGGYARLKTAIDAEKADHPDALLVDGGDFSIGSLVQTLYTTQAAELRTMGALGYDATTFGNHEFDHTGTGLASMLNAAADSGDTLPALVEANYKPSDDNADRDEIQAAMDSYGVSETTLIERGGVTYGIFGLMGVDGNDCAPTSGFTLEDAATAAERCVERLQEQGADIIIALSHSGTDEDVKKSEDEQLAKAVDGIDVIVSGHTHSTLTEPIVVNDTYIVSGGPYCQNLGSLTFTVSAGGEKTLVDYHLTAIDETLTEDGDIADLVESWKTQVGETYLDRYDLTYDQVLTALDFDLSTPDYSVQEGNALGELVADAFHWASATLAANGDDTVPTVAITAAGVLRASLAAGDITTSQAFDVLSMGVGSDGTSGFPLVAVYLTGKELKAAAEVDASVTPIMPAAQLYMSGMTYSFNTHRMFFNRVTDISLEEPAYLASDTQLTAIDDDQLYRVVTGMYSAQMLGTVKSKSMGLLSLEPKMADGTAVTDFNDCILRTADGSELKEWYALAAYLQSFGTDGVPDRYEQADLRKSVSSSWNIAELLAAVVLVLLAVLAARAIRRRRRR